MGNLVLSLVLPGASRLRRTLGRWSSSSFGETPIADAAHAREKQAWVGRLDWGPEERTRSMTGRKRRDQGRKEKDDITLYRVVSVRHCRRTHRPGCRYDLPSSQSGPGTTVEETLCMGTSCLCMYAISVIASSYDRAMASLLPFWPFVAAGVPRSRLAGFPRRCAGRTGPRTALDAPVDRVCSRSVRSNDNRADRLRVGLAG